MSHQQSPCHDRRYEEQTSLCPLRSRDRRKGISLEEIRFKRSHRSKGVLLQKPVKRQKSAEHRPRFDH
ncbi:hypothetical protein [Teredinibacter sp. KSP-S5-2]|uniref:hypothetical protein n=1 Tax=Teredinibacter sp. KSP-S5-2 TaxID=3034506 RepID=UPI002934F59C|nr:hypothetical protein [Teredinibacter sp. KSP-S5-2]WNO11414.1 hypothetical protein P5V12_09550 [Teredinibacter sp. KSP-S5-2]